MILGIIKFLHEVMDMEDTVFATNQQLLEWMQDPKTLDQLKDRATSGSLSCPADRVIQKKDKSKY